MKMKRVVAGAVAAGALSLGSIGIVNSASAQPPPAVIAANNLVNVQVVDVLNNLNVVVDVFVPVNAAVAVCDAVDANVGAGVLGEALVLVDGQDFTGNCDAIATQG